MRSWMLVVPALFIFAVPAHAQDDGQAQLDEALSFFMLDAAHARSALRSHGLEARADRLWSAAGQYAGAVSEADPEVQPLFLPILQGLRTAMADSAFAPGETDLAAVDALLATLDDQVRIQTAPGADPAKDGVRVTIRARRNGQVVGSYYVWMDLTGSIPRNRKATSNALSETVSDATAFVVPGDYLIRLVDGNSSEVARRVATIGEHGAVEPLITVIIP